MSYNLQHQSAVADASPLRGAAKLARALNTMVDAQDDDRTRRQLASIVESSDDAIISKNLDGVVTSWNKGAQRLFGFAPEEIIGKPIAILIPPERLGEDLRNLDRIRRGEHVEPYETVRVCKDGSTVQISLTVSPIKDASGGIVGASKIARDISERKRAEDQRKLLLRELNHRVKNLFAVANAVVALSARSAKTPEDLAAAIRGRLGALARAHDLIAPRLLDSEEEDRNSTTLDALAGVILAPFVSNADAAHTNSVRLDGPTLSIAGIAATSLALALHELAANAAKYGSLSYPKGYVQVGWAVVDSEMRLRWEEHDGPSVERAPEFEGFGSSLLRRSIIGQLGGRLAFEWRPNGLAVDLSLPLDRLDK